MHAPLVSVIVPCRNSGKTIQAAIDSVLSQTVSDFEVIVVDDHSSDNTTRRVAEICARDPRVRLIARSFWNGASAARNTGMREARSTYIAFLDSDDLWLPEKLELQLRAMEESGAGLCYSAYRRFDDVSGRVGHVIEVPE